MAGNTGPMSVVLGSIIYNNIINGIFNYLNKSLHMLVKAVGTLKTTENYRQNSKITNRQTFLILV